MEWIVNASIVLETAIQKIWLRMKAGEMPSLIVISKNLGIKMPGFMLMRSWFYKSKVLTLILGDLIVILPQTLISQLGPYSALQRRGF